MALPPWYQEYVDKGWMTQEELDSKKKEAEMSGMGYPAIGQTPIIPGSGFQPGYSAEAVAGDQAAREWQQRFPALQTTAKAEAIKGLAGQAAGLNLQQLLTDVGRTELDPESSFMKTLRGEANLPKLGRGLGTKGQIEALNSSGGLDPTAIDQVGSQDLVKMGSSGAGSLPLAPFFKSGAERLAKVEYTPSGAQNLDLVSTDKELMQELSNQAAKQAGAPFQSAIRDVAQSSYMRNPYGGAQTQSALAGMEGRKASAQATAGSSMLSNLLAQNEELRQNQLLADRGLQQGEMMKASDVALEQGLSDRELKQSEQQREADIANQQLLGDRGLAQDELQKELESQRQQKLSDRTMQQQQDLQDRALKQQMTAADREMILNDIRMADSDLYLATINAPKEQQDLIMQLMALGLGQQLSSTGNTNQLLASLQDNRGGSSWTDVLGAIGSAASGISGMKNSF